MALADGTLIDREALDGLLALIPEDKRDEARSLYSKVHDSARTAAEEMAEQEAALQRWHTQLRTWAGQKETEYQRRERELAEARRAGGQPNPNPKPAGGDPPTPVPGNGGLSKDELDDYLNQRFEHFGRMVVGAGSEQARLQQRHAQLYKGGQIFDPEELYRHPLAKTHGLTAAFEQIHKDQITAAAEAARKDAEDKIRADERQKVQQELAARGGQNMPFPTPGEDDSAIGILERRNAENKEQFGAEAASRFYQSKLATGQWPV